MQRFFESLESQSGDFNIRLQPGCFSRQRVSTPRDALYVLQNGFNSGLPGRERLLNGLSRHTASLVTLVKNE